MPNNEDEWIDEVLESIEVVSSMSGNDTGKYWIEGLPEAKATIKAKLLEARLDEIRLSNLTSAIDNVRARYMKNRVIELKAQLQASATTYGGRRIDE